MTNKNRGIRLKPRLNEDDQGHQTLMRVAFLQSLALNGETAEPEVTHEGATPLPAAVERQEHEDQQPSMDQVRRREVVQVLRIGLEDTLALLDDALDASAQSDQ